MFNSTEGVILAIIRKHTVRGSQGLPVWVPYSYLQEELMTEVIKIEERGIIETVNAR